jgi:hypothetical protein
MFFQLGLGSIIEDRLKSYWGIDLSAQPDKNRSLARLGSLCGFDGLKFCTIDLKSASDMPLNMAKSVYPRDILQYILKYRSESTQIPGLGSYKLDILSSMGNGFTFPLQTALFAAIILTCYRVNNVTPDFPFGDKLGNFGVFGDDLIIDASCKDDLFILLDVLGFTINYSKSFVEGPFRESCGLDYFNGVDVRGVYLKTLKTPQSRYSSINLLNEWSAVNGILLRSTISLLLKTVRFIPVPRWENPDAGIQLPFALTGLKASGTVAYRHYRAEALTWTIKDLGFLGPKHLIDRLIYNPHGLWLSFLMGNFKDGLASVRQTDVRYRLRTATSPCWDYEPSSWIPTKLVEERSPVKRRASWERWNTVSYQNHDMT